MKALFFRHAWLFKVIMNLWPPFFFPGIKVMRISPDYRYARIDLKWRPWTRNINNSQFGGSLFAMTDPIVPLLLFGCLGWDKYIIWDKYADIDYIAPGKGRLSAEFHMEEVDLHAIKQATANGDKHFPEFKVYVRDQQGELVCTLTRRLYVRLRSPYRCSTRTPLGRF
ncbi:MAG: DUF4442 domain-containing protein [Natronospirillum sp.]